MKVILVTGGAGSLGREVVDILISRGCKVRAMDINEAGLANLLQLGYPPDLFTVEYGDVRNYGRVIEAMQGCDTVIHTAAMKNLDITEGDVSEMILTNTIGSDNVARAAKALGVECAILISTDKAVSPTSAYGASKLLAEKEWLCKSRQTVRSRFVIFRSGNFKQSAGNVLETWNRQETAGVSLTVTDLEMERYFIDTRKAAELICDIPMYAANGDIIIPKMELVKILDLLNEQFPGCTYKIVGARPGEKQVEKLMSDDERVVHDLVDVMVIA